MDEPVIHGDPMTPERLKEFMAQIRTVQDVTPFMRFMERAKVAGFSEPQAQFLWDLHLMPTPRF